MARSKSGIERCSFGVARNSADLVTDSSDVEGRASLSGEIQDARVHRRRRRVVNHSVRPPSRMRLHGSASLSMEPKWHAHPDDESGGFVVEPDWPPAVVDVAPPAPVGPEPAGP